MEIVSDLVNESRYIDPGLGELCLQYISTVLVVDEASCIVGINLCTVFFVRVISR